jgi:hypothetical protein
MRLADEREIPSDQFGTELECMEQFKMVLRREGPNGKRHWRFRHDKVMDFFIVQASLGPKNSRAMDHLADPRFHGVYFQLAALLPYDEALAPRVNLSDDVPPAITSRRKRAFKILPKPLPKPCRALCCSSCSRSLECPYHIASLVDGFLARF